MRESSDETPAQDFRKQGVFIIHIDYNFRDHRSLRCCGEGENAATHKARRSRQRQLIDKSPNQLHDQAINLMGSLSKLWVLEQH